MGTSVFGDRAVAGPIFFPLSLHGECDREIDELSAVRGVFMTHRAILAWAAAVAASVLVLCYGTSLGAAEDDKVTGLIEKLDSGNSFKVRMQAAILLGRIGDKKAVKP